MTRRALAFAACAVLLAACGNDVPSPSASDVAPTATPSATLSAQPSATLISLALPDPGRPYDSGTLLAAMRDSRRPGGVPDALETDAVASALAEAIWTLDGRPWSTMAAGGSCGPETCTLEVSGAAAGAEADDLWVFDVEPGTGAIRVASAELRSLPAGLAADLDVLVRSLVEPDALESLFVTSARWLPPPAEGRFVLSYRSGGEEGGSCGTDLTVDAVVPEIVSDPAIAC
jgi:hypothetical protein